MVVVQSAQARQLASGNKIQQDQALSAGRTAELDHHLLPVAATPPGNKEILSSSMRYSTLTAIAGFRDRRTRSTITDLKCAMVKKTCSSSTATPYPSAAPTVKPHLEPQTLLYGSVTDYVKEQFNLADKAGRWRAQGGDGRSPRCGAGWPPARRYTSRSAPAQ